MTERSFPPPGTTDCHTHLVGAQSRYPMTSPRSYTPAPVSPADMQAMMRRIGLSRIVVVQISVYATNNACLLDGLRALGDCARGVAQVDEAATGAMLDELHMAGIRGLRVNLSTAGVNDPAEARDRLAVAADKCARNGWHLQVFTSPDVIAGIGAHLRALPVPLVIDHFGLLSVQERNGEAERVVCDLLGTGRGWVKVSGSYRLDRPDATAAVASLARDLYRANPQNILWGSDWPHPPEHNSRPEPDPDMRPYRDIAPEDMLATIHDWFADPADRNRILVENPARLYGFPPL